MFLVYQFVNCLSQNRENDYIFNEFPQIRHKNETILHLLIK